MSGHRWTRATLLVYALSMPLYAIASLTGELSWVDFSTAFTALAWFAFSLSHCAFRFGPARTAFMLFSAFAIALTAEYLGSTYGFIFGAYQYTDRLGPKAFGVVPLIIPLAWFMMLYPSWMLAGVIQRRIAFARRAARSALRVVLAALAMTAWDLSLDPRMVQEGAWVWQPTNALAYFGIPLTNFVGWFVTAAAIYVVWSWAVRDATEAEQPHHATLPVLAYAIAWLGESFANLVFWGRPAVALCTAVAMGLFAVPAIRDVLSQSVRTTRAHQPAAL